jgi:TIR domain
MIMRSFVVFLLKIVVPTVMGSVLAVLAIASVLYRWRVKAFVHLRLHPFDVDECEGEEMLYDVFLSCAYEDSDLARRIMNRLERVSDNDLDAADDDLLPPGGYRVCYHERDFRPGDLIMKNIQRAIERSKRVICLLTPDFVKSEFCMMEFRGAWSHHTRIKKRRLVVVKWPEVDLSSVTDQDNAMDLKMFLSTHTYVDRGTMNWWHQIIYALTTHGLPQSTETTTPAINDNVLREASSTEHLLADQE